MEAVAPIAPARCDTTQRRAVIAAARELGVPADYGRQRGLRVVREPAQLHCIGRDIHDRWQWLAPPAAHAWQRMKRTASDDGIDLQLVSAFRSAEYQLGIIRRKCERGLAMDDILRVSAAPGYSEHHSGRCVDVTTPGHPALEEAFEESAAFGWLMHNAHRHRFRLSYPRGNPHGIAYEPWHWCWQPR